MLLVHEFNREIAKTTHTKLVLDAFEQANWAHGKPSGVIDHNYTGSQYLSNTYSNRLCAQGFKPFVGSTGDSYDNAVAESVIGLYQTELINCKRFWKAFEDVEYAT